MWRAAALFRPFALVMGDGIVQVGGGRRRKSCPGAVLSNSRNRIVDPVHMAKEKKNGADGQEDISMSAAQWANVIHPDTESNKHHEIDDTSDKVPQAMEGTLAAVAASVIHSVSGMSRWGLAEATLGLYKLHCRHVHDGVIDTINGTLVTSGTEMQELVHWIKWAEAAYEEKTKPCAQALEVPEDSIVKLVTKSAIGKPAFLVGLNHSKEAVVLSVRGTFSALDVLTDMQPHSERFANGQAHSGMLNSAKWIRDNVVDVLKDLMANHGYRLVVTGHSLGAGTATLLTMLLRETNKEGLTVLGSKPEQVTCWGYCCPPCVDKKLAEETTFIRCVVHQDDIVARISPAAVEGLRNEILQTDWTQALQDGTKKKLIMELAQSSLSFVDRIEPVLKVEKGALLNQVKQQGFSVMKGWTDSLTLSWNKVSEGGYGPKAKQAASLLTMGAVAAGAHMSTTGKEVADSMNKAIEQQMQLIEQDSREGAALTASNMAAEAKVINEREGEFLEKNRLFVPGILYHVIRQPLQPDDKLPAEHPVEAGTGKNEKLPAEHPVEAGTGKDEKLPAEQPVEVRNGNDEMLTAESPGEAGTDRDAKKDRTLYKHIVVRGDDPSSRFERIVLSSSFISDHLCPGLKDALTDAMEWQHSGRDMMPSKS